MIPFIAGSGVNYRKIFQSSMALNYARGLSCLDARRPAYERAFKDARDRLRSARSHVFPAHGGDAAGEVCIR
jgi:hypothetical protein